ncbi:MAG: hypothetical protein P1U86_05860 [Verrucomicrobiales bacterium]|nr:hypothetical protein [Verrucomicrobiales bacterium]
MKKHILRPRLRLEFSKLEAQLEPGFEAKAWKQFHDSVVHGIPATRSFGEQFALQDKTCRAHARRDRYNDQRRLRKLKNIQKQFHPRIAALVAGDRVANLDLLPAWDKKLGVPKLDNLCAVFAVDVRYSRKFLEECEVVHRWLNPTRHPEAIQSIPLTEKNRSVFPPQSEAFLQTLAPTPVPEATEDLKFVHPSETSAATLDEESIRKAPGSAEKAS